MLLGSGGWETMLGHEGWLGPTIQGLCGSQASGRWWVRDLGGAVSPMRNHWVPEGGEDR